jgi:transcriptional regulator with XRE-family HTH domain
VVDHIKFFKALGQHVKELRKRRGYSQEDMIAFGFSARHWQQIEAGRPITMTTLLRICDALRVRIAVIVRGTDKTSTTTKGFPRKKTWSHVNWRGWVCRYAIESLQQPVTERVGPLRDRDFLAYLASITGPIITANLLVVLFEWGARGLCEKPFFELSTSTECFWVTFGPKVIIGKVKWFTHTGGYGLIKRSDGRPFYLVHQCLCSLRFSDGPGAASSVARGLLSEIGWVGVAKVECHPVSATKEVRRLALLTCLSH